MQIKFLQADHGRNFASLALRISAAMMLFHGWGKMVNFSDKSLTFADPIGIGSTGSLALTVFAEVFCTFFIVFGLYTRAATIPLIICMFVAAVFAHSGDPLSDREGALGYLLLYVAIFFLGGGRFSADNYLRKNSNW
ncbi:MAG TPA: DoxX family protein [Bacteroidia bacterium]|nr:DoxX family protein [Bacteroidia bacterium]